MKEKILAALKTKFKNLGFGDKAFDGVATFLAITVTEETAIETAIGGVEPLLKSFQGDADKRVTDAIAKLKAEKDQDKGADPEKKTEPEKTDPNEPAWFTAYKQEQKTSMEALKLETETFKANKAKEDRASAIKAKAKELGISENLVKRLNIADDADIDTELTEYKQELVNSGVQIDVPASSGGVKEGEAFAKSIAEKRNTNTSEGVEGKKI